jgi:hypothetical protein
VAVASAEAGVGAVRVDDLPAEALLTGIRVCFAVGAAVSSLAIAASMLRGEPIRELGRQTNAEPQAAAQAPPAQHKVGADG